MLLQIDGSREPIWVVPDESRVQIATIAPLPAVPPKRSKIPRPPNAYILYRKERHSMVRDANPGISNNEICMSPFEPWYEWHADYYTSSNSWTSLEP